MNDSMELKLHPYNGNLPTMYKVQLDKESECRIHSIQSFCSLLESRQNLQASVQAHQFREVHAYLDLKHKLSHELRFKLCKALLHYIFELEPAPNVDDQTKALKLLSRLLGKHWKNQQLKNNLSIDWRMIYEKFQAKYFGKMRTPPESGFNVHVDHKSALLAFIRVARRYFLPTAVHDIWSLLSPAFENPFSNCIFKALGEMCLFLPPHADYSPYVATWIEIWGRISHSPEWDSHWFLILSRAVKHSTHFDWASFISFIYSRILNALRLPAGEGKLPDARRWPSAYLSFRDCKKHSGIRLIAKTCVYLMGKVPTEFANGNEIAISTSTESLAKLLSMIQTFYHPSNPSELSDSLGDLMKFLSLFLAKRLGYEQGMCTQNALAQADVDYIVQQLLVLVKLSIFSKQDTLVSSAQQSMRDLASIRPRLVCQELMPLLLAALDESAANHSHQAPGAMRALTALIAPLVHGTPFLSMYLPTILRLTLPGIDPNDTKKTIHTILLYSYILDWIPMVDETTTGHMMPIHEQMQHQQQTLFYAPEQLEDVDQANAKMLAWKECWLSGPFLSQWVLAYLDRIFLVLKNAEKSSKATGYVKHMARQMSQMLSEALLRLFSQLSGDIYDMALKKSFEFVESSFLPDSGKYVASLVSACTFAHPAKCLKLFLPFLFSKLLGSENATENLSHLEIQWYLRILHGVVKKSGSAILTYQVHLSIILEKLATHPVKPIRKLACKVLKHTLMSLLECYPLETRFVPPKLWAKHGLWQNWGHVCSWEDIEIQWHEPSKEEVLFAMKLLKTHAEDSITEMKRLIEGGIILSPLWRSCAQQLMYSVRGALGGLSAPTFSSKEESVGSKKGDVEKSSLSSFYFEGLRKQMACFCHATFQFWGAQSKSGTDIKPMQLLIQVAYLILHSWGAKEEKLRYLKTSLGMIKKSFYTFSATDSRSKANYLLSKNDDLAFPSSRFRVGPSRRLLVESVYLHHKLRLVEESYVVVRALEFSVSEDKVIYNDLVDDLTCLSYHHYDIVQATACASLRSTFKKFPWCLEAQINSLIEKLSCGNLSKAEAVGTIALLQQNRSLKLIASNWERMSSFLIHIAQSHQLIAGVETDYQSKVEQMLQTLFTSFLKQWKSIPCGSPAAVFEVIQEISATNQDSGVHWRYQFLHLACMIPLIRLDCHRSSEMWKTILHGVHSDVEPIRKLGIHLLSRLLSCVKFYSKLQGYAYPNPKTWTKTTFLNHDLLQKLIDGMVHDHKVASRSADGESVDNSPMNWSVGVGSVLSQVTERYKPFPYARHSSISLSFNSLHAQLSKALTELLGLDFIKAVAPILSDSFTCPFEERRASLCTVVEILSGMIRAITKPKSHMMEQKKEEVWGIVMSLMTRVLEATGLEWVSDSVDAMRFAVFNRMPCDVQRVLDFLSAQIQLSMSANTLLDDYSTQAKWLKLLQGVLIEFAAYQPAWKSCRDFVSKLVPILCNAMGHPYKVCREELGRTLFLISTESLMDGEGIEMKSMVQSIAIAALTDDDDTACTKKTRVDHMRETIMYWLVHSVHAADVYMYKNYIIELVPVIFATQKHPNVEMAALAKYSLGVVAQGYRFLHLQPRKDIVAMIALLKTYARSSNWNIRAAFLRYMIPFLSLNFFSVSFSDRRGFCEMIVDLLLDGQREIQELAHKVLTGMMAAEDLSVVKQMSERFLKEAQAFSKSKARQPSRFRSFRRLQQGKEHSALNTGKDLVEKKVETEDGMQETQALMRQQELGVLGLSSIILAFPYRIPSFFPELLVELVQHLHGSPAFIQKHVAKTISDFKRTHQDDWENHKQSFTSDQLEALSDLLIAPHYYA